MIDVREFITEDGQSPFAAWFKSLDARTSARVVVARAKLEQGLFGDSKSVHKGVQEYRMKMRGSSALRIYYARDGDKIVILLGGGSKRTQANDISDAQALWQNYRQRKGKET